MMQNTILIVKLTHQFRIWKTQFENLKIWAKSKDRNINNISIIMSVILGYAYSKEDIDILLIFGYFLS